MPGLHTLDPRLRSVAEAFFRWARKRYPTLVVTSARRTRQEQQVLYERYLRGQNDGLPATPPGSSSHELGLAWDMARLNVPAVSDDALRDLGSVWSRWGGKWWSGDPVHFAWAPGVHQAALAGRAGRRSRARRTSRRPRTSRPR